MIPNFKSWFFNFQVILIFNLINQFHSKALFILHAPHPQCHEISSLSNLQKFYDHCGPLKSETSFNFFLCPQWSEKFMQIRKWGNFMTLRMRNVEYEPGFRGIRPQSTDIKSCVVSVCSGRYGHTYNELHIYLGLIMEILIKKFRPNILYLRNARLSQVQTPCRNDMTSYR